MKNIYKIKITPEAIIKMLMIMSKDNKLDSSDSHNWKNLLVNSEPISMNVDSEQNILNIYAKTNIYNYCKSQEGEPLPYRGPIHSWDIQEEPIKPKNTKTWKNVKSAKDLVKKLRKK